MRERRQAAGSGDGRDDLRHVGAATRDERRPIVAEQAVEGISTIEGVPGRHERVGNERTSDTPAAGRRGRRQEGVDIDGAVQGLQPERNFSHALDPRESLHLRESDSNFHRRRESD